MVAMLYNYAKYKGYDVTASADLSKFADNASVSTWAQPAMQWAVAEGYISGMGDSQLAPCLLYTSTGKAYWSLPIQIPDINHRNHRPL